MSPLVVAGFDCGAIEAGLKACATATTVAGATACATTATMGSKQAARAPTAQSSGEACATATTATIAIAATCATPITIIAGINLRVLADTAPRWFLRFAVVAVLFVALIGSLPFRQREDVERVAVLRILQLGCERARHEPRTFEAAASRRDRDVLAPADRERHRIPLHRRAEPRLPQRLAGPDVERAEHPIDVADKTDAAGRRQDRRQKRRALLAAPHFPQRLDVVRRELAEIAVAARHLEEPAVGARAALTF